MKNKLIRLITILLSVSIVTTSFSLQMSASETISGVVIQNEWEYELKDDIMTWTFLKDDSDIVMTIENGVCNVEQIKLEQVREFLDSIYEELQESGFEFAYRTVKEIRQYYAAAYELQKGNFNLTRTMDEQIVQKILPKIYGDRKQIGELLDTLEEKCKNGIGDSSEEMTLSLKKIEQMKKRLDKYQYASFM